MKLFGCFCEKGRNLGRFDVLNHGFSPVILKNIKMKISFLPLEMLGLVVDFIPKTLFEVAA